MISNWDELEKMARAELDATIRALPKPLREQVEKLPVLLEETPDEQLQADGIELDTLGLFTGNEFAEESGNVLPPQLILFLRNIWDYAEGDEMRFRDEIRTTFLHELGHFFGLDEDDLTARGLQ